jgi:undecaprenyl-diphosphatase
MIPIDRHLLFLINHEWTHPSLDRALGTLSCLDFWMPLLVLGAVVLVWRRGWVGIACVVVCGMGVLTNETLVAQPLKKWTARPRPYQSEEGTRRVDLAQGRPRLFSIVKPPAVEVVVAPDRRGAGRSFPSAHTLNAMTLGLVLARFLRQRLWWLLPPLMAWSRVYTGSHWPSDVLASLGMGFLLTQTVLWVAWRASRRGVPPFTHAAPFLAPAGARPSLT